MDRFPNFILSDLDYFPRWSVDRPTELFMVRIPDLETLKHAQIDVHFGRDYPITPMRQYFGEEDSLYNITVSKGRRNNYSLLMFFNNLRTSSYTDDREPWELVTERERKYFSRLGYAVLCRFFRTLPSDSTVSLKPRQMPGLIQYYKSMGFEWSGREMVADVSTLQEMCAKQAGDSEKHITFVLDAGSTQL